MARVRARAERRAASRALLECLRGPLLARLAACQARSSLDLAATPDSEMELLMRLDDFKGTMRRDMLTV